MHRSNLKFSVLRGGVLFPKYRLIEDYEFEFIHNERPAMILIPAGFETDGATGRKLVGWGKMVNVGAATFLHDYAYVMAGKPIGLYKDTVGERFSPSKRDMDTEFIKAMKRQFDEPAFTLFLARFAFVTVGSFLWFTKKWGLRS